MVGAKGKKASSMEVIVGGATEEDKAVLSSLCPSFTEASLHSCNALCTKTKTNKIVLVLAQELLPRMWPPITVCGWTALSMCKEPYNHDWDFHHYTVDEQPSKSQTRLHWDGWDSSSAASKGITRPTHIYGEQYNGATKHNYYVGRGYTSFAEFVKIVHSAL